MSADRESEEEIFDVAREIASADEQAAYLARMCGANADLRERIEGMLKADAAAGEFFNRAEDPRPTILVEGNSPAGSIEKAGERIGRYKLLQQIGEGGMGVVYMAEQEEPVRRIVALKIIKLGMDTRQVVARFEAERQALAMMDQPHIAKVLDAGATKSGRPYFVMELVRGIPITEYCDKNCLPTRQRLELFIQVCQAVQHAHQKGIIHRDLKPSNILVTLHDGVPWPMIIDFGVAKATHQRLTEKTLFTHFAQMIGTPAYMSPEQAEMSKLDVDTRTDIYALGVVLYELLTGAPPFSTRELLNLGYQEMQRTIAEKEPLRPSTRLSTMANEERSVVARNRNAEASALAKLFRGDLDWIAMKCLEKDRTRRYETANGLATDVQRYLNTEPVAARPASRLYRFQKLIRRNKLAFGAACAVAAALVIGLGLSTWLFLKERGTRQRAEMAERDQAQLRQRAEAAQVSERSMRQEAEAQTLAARRKAYASDMGLLQQALARDDLGRAQQLLDRQRPKPGQEDLRGWEWRYAWQFCQSEDAFTLCQRSNRVTSVSFSSNGILLAVATYPGEVSVWDLSNRQMVYEHPAGKIAFASDGDAQAYTSFGRGKVAFAPEGYLLAYYDGANPQKAIVLWDARKRAESRRLPLNGPVRDFAFSRDGRLFTCGTTSSNYAFVADGSVLSDFTIWDVHSGAALNVLSGPHAGYAIGSIFAITGDGNKFAYRIEGGKRVGVHDLVAHTMSLLKVPGDWITALAFSLDGQILATGEGYANGDIRLWDDQNQPLGSLEGHRAWVSCLKALPDGRTLASASGDRTIRLWDLKTHQPLRTLRGDYGELCTLGVSPDGRWLATGSKEGSVNLWDLTSSTNRPPVYRTFPGTNYLEDLSYSSDGRFFGGVQNGHLQLFQTATPEHIEAELPGTNITGFAFAPDSLRLAATDDSGHLSLWEIPSMRVITNFAAHSGWAVLIGTGFMDGGRSLLTCGARGVAKKWDVANWREIRRFQMDIQVSRSAVSPGADFVATLNRDKTIEVFSARSPEMRRHFTGKSRIGDIKLSPDGKTLASASDSGTVELWDTATGTRTAALGGVLLGYHSVAFSPDGERLVAGSNGQEAIKIWDLHSLEEVATLPGRGSLFEHARFSPDGNTIVARNRDYWSAPSWNEIKAAELARHR